MMKMQGKISILPDGKRRVVRFYLPEDAVCVERWRAEGNGDAITLVPSNFGYKAGVTTQGHWQIGIPLTKIAGPLPSWAVGDFRARLCHLVLQGGAIHITMDAAPTQTEASCTLALADHVQAIRDALAADENLMVDVENAGRDFRLVRKINTIEVVA